MVHRSPTHLLHGPDVSGVQRAIAISLASGLTVVTVFLGAQTVGNNLSQLFGEAALQSSADMSLELVPASPALTSATDAHGNWAARAQVAVVERSRAVIDTGTGNHTVNLLGAHVRGLPAGVTDLSLLEGATVILRGYCAERRPPSGCVIITVNVIEFRQQASPSSTRLRSAGNWRHVALAA
jgi:hypothetical protein